MPAEGAIALLVDKLRGAITVQQLDDVLTEFQATPHAWSLRRATSNALTSVHVDDADLPVDEAALHQHCQLAGIHTEEVCLLFRGVGSRGVHAA